LTSSDDCGDVLGAPFTRHAVWLDDSMSIVASAEVPATGISAATPDGRYLALAEEYDPDRGVQYVDLQVFAQSGSTAVELDRVSASGSVHGLDDGVLIRDAEGFDAYDLDGTLRWSLDVSANAPSPVPLAETVVDGQVVLAWGVTRELTVGGQMPDPAAVEAGADLWVVVVDADTGAVVETALVILGQPAAELAVEPLGGGEFLVVERTDGNVRFAVVRDGERVESRSYVTEPRSSCFGGGCPARPVHAVSTPFGIWSLGSAAQGTTTYDGPAVTNTAPRPHLVRWSR